MRGRYILAEDGKTAVPCDDLMTWAKSQDLDKRRVDWTELHDGTVKVSTVFLGPDHGFCDGAPLLWETMIFGGEHDEYQERYSTYEDAVAGHAVAVKLAAEGAP